jgi:stage II sporulation protein GA (sporulation sigma-E factor processing peptidase)
MLLNFLVDFFLLLGTNKLAGFPADPKRAAAGALLGGVYSGACLLPRLRFLGAMHWRLVSLAAMSAVAFGLNRSGAKRGGIFLLLAMALGGIALSFGRGNWLSLLLASFGIWLLCYCVFDRTLDGREFIPLELAYGGNTLRLTALRDSGNSLRDPITGEQVLVLSARAAEDLTGLTPEQLRAPLETLEKRPLPGLRLIPYRAVGTDGGFLLGLRFENVRIGKKQCSAVAAFAPEGLGREEGFQALAGGML